MKIGGSVFFTVLLGILGSTRIPHVCSNSTVPHWGPYLQQVTAPFEHSEGPTWNPANNLLYFVDIHKGLVISFNPRTNHINQVKLDGDVTPVIPTRIPNRYMVGLNKSLVLLEWDGKTDGEHKVTVIANVDRDKDGNRFNDGKADAKGRLWLGTMGYENSTGVIPNQASLFKIVMTGANTNKPYDQNPHKNEKITATITTEISPVSISNGLAWTRDFKKFYYIDTPTRQIAAYDFNIATGSISNKKIAFDLSKYDIGGHPDGMTIDKEDNLYIALFNGGAVIKVDPSKGTLLRKIAIPAHKVTSVMFGGRNLDILFVTTSRFGLSDDERKEQPGAGSIFAITGLGTAGRKMYPANF